MTTSRHPDRPVLDRTVRVDEVSAAGESVEIVAGPNDLEPLALAIGVERVLSAHATLRLAPASGGAVQVKGEARASVEQICVVTLDPFETEIVEAVDVRFAPPSEVAEAEARLRTHPPDNESETPDLPEPIVDGTLALGALVQEILALGVDPYPRKPGVAFEGGRDAADERVSPFAALAKLQTPPPRED